MRYKVIATYVFDVEADEPEWAQELIDVNCLHYHIQSLDGKETYPTYEVYEACHNPIHYGLLVRTPENKTKCTQCGEVW